MIKKYDVKLISLSICPSRYLSSGIHISNKLSRSIKESNITTEYETTALSSEKENNFYHFTLSTFSLRVGESNAISRAGN